jgi:predicted GH43/DUF377 family glycosyl hydrolase
MDLFEKTDRPVLTPQPDVPWASGAVFNPGAWYDGELVHLLYRAIPAGYRRVTVAGAAPGEPQHGYDDYVSYIGYASSPDGLRFTAHAIPFLAPDADFDRYGAEDPRISRIDGTYLIAYTALSHPAFGAEDGVRIGLASTSDFRDVRKHGVVGPPVRDKDAVIFPRPIRGRIAMLHRIVPDVQVVFFDDLEQLFRPPERLWQEHLRHLDRAVVLRPEAAWEASKVGAGPTPIETEAGWLLIYHGVDDRYVYRAGLALLDPDDPQRVLARTPLPVLEPEKDFERSGDVDNVVFPEGAVVLGDMLHVYYGAADRVVGHATAPLADVLALLDGCRR